MRTAWLLAALVACGSPTTPGVSNVAPKLPPPSGRAHVGGIIVDATAKEPLAGVTVVINQLKDAVAITDENGKYEIPLPPGHYRMTFYYLELTVERDVDVNGPTKVDQDLDQHWGAQGMPTVRCTGARTTTCQRRTP